MGRKAKLRACRNTEAKQLEQRRATQKSHQLASLQESIKVDVNRVLHRLGAHSTDQAKIEQDWEKLWSEMTPTAKTQYVGFLYYTFIREGVDTQSLNEADRQFFIDLQIIKNDAPELFVSWCEFCGMHMLFTNPDQDWDRVRKNLLLITQHPLLQPALRAFGLGGDANAPMLQIIRNANGSQRALLAGDKPRTQELFEFGERWIPLDDHLESAGDLAAGRILCDAGRLVLHYRRAERLEEAELCLSCRSNDGLLSFFPLDRNRLPIKAIRILRRFTKDYQGPRMAGKISPHPAALRLCKAIGLATRHGYGFLEPS
jgi:hypothetical protein